MAECFLICAAIGLLAAQAAGAQSGKEVSGIDRAGEFPMSFAEKELYRRGADLCEWKLSQFPPADPPALRVCTEGPQVPPADVERELDTWWHYWFEQDQLSFFDAKDAFAKWGRDKKMAQYAARHEDQIEQSARTLNVYELCSEYRGSASPAAKREILRRKLLTPDEWKLVSSRKIRIGMSDTALICSWGSTEVNRTVSANSVHEQYVYKDTYVYVENGRVVAYQD